MNRVVLMGRLTKDPDIRYSQGANPMAIARYSLAVDRRFAKNGENETDFINIVAFGKSAEFAEKYMHKGMKMLVTGRLQTSSYTNKDGQKINTTEVVVDDQEFCESKSANQSAGSFAAPTGEGTHKGDENDFMKFDSDDNVSLPF